MSSVLEEHVLACHDNRTPVRLESGGNCDRHVRSSSDVPPSDRQGFCYPREPHGEGISVVSRSIDLRHDEKKYEVSKTRGTRGAGT
jgi:hypothetical protein